MPDTYDEPPGSMSEEELRDAIWALYLIASNPYTQASRGLQQLRSMLWDVVNQDSQLKEWAITYVQPALALAAAGEE